MNTWTFTLEFTRLLLWLFTFTLSERVALAATFLVFIGVAGEYIIEIKEVEGRPILKTRIKRLSMALLLLGLAGDVLGVVMGQAEMAALTQEAGDAKTSAEGAALAADRAGTSADNANIVASKALDKSKEATDAAGRAQGKVDAVAKQSDKLKGELSAAKTQLDAVEAKRAELEKSLINLAICNAPRVIKPWNTIDSKGRHSYLDPLLPMREQVVIIEVISEAEARRAANSLARTLRNAGWDVRGPSKIDDLDDGVAVQASVSMSDGTMYEQSLKISASWRADDVADALLDFLHSYNWQARFGWPHDTAGNTLRDENILPVGAIRVQVGLYPPSEFVTPPARKDAAEAFVEFDQQRQAQINKAKADGERKEEEILKTLPPELSAQYRTENAKRRQDEKHREERFNGPCQPLTPYP